MMERRPITIAAFAGFIIGSIVTSLFLWHFGSAFGLSKKASQTPSSIPTSNRWPVEEPGQKDGDAVLRTPPPVPLRYSPAKKDASRATPEPSSEASSEMVQDLRKRHLLLPVEGADPKDLRTSFHEARGGRVHEAIDILAPRNTPVLAVEDGTVAKLYFSDRGGITVYEFDPEKNYVYYYAHLERYAEGLKEADPVKRGQVIGYVGTSGNAPKDTPHLHFAIVRLNEDKHWWEGNPIDPFLVLR